MLLVLENKEDYLKLPKSALEISGSMGIMVPSGREILVNWVARPNKRLIGKFGNYSLVGMRMCWELISFVQ